MQDWEVSLLTNTRAFVKQALPGMAPEEREQVVVDVYIAMHRTLKRLHKKSSSVLSAFVSS